MKKLILFISLICFMSLRLNAQINVLVVGAETTLIKLTDIDNKLTATGLFNNVDVYQANIGTPTLAFLQTYNAVLVFSNFNYSNATSLGDVMAQYVDGGGGVVLAAFDFNTTAARNLAGAFNTVTYRVINPGASASGTATLGTVLLPAHRVMASVSTFINGTGSNRINSSTLYPGSGAYTIAQYNTGQILVAARDNAGTAGNKKRVDVNFFPESNSITSDLWDASTDGAKILANALLYVSCPGPVISSSGTAHFCGSPGPVTFTASTGSTYLWSTGETTQGITVSAVGSYSVTVDGIPACNTATVTVNAATTITPSGPTTLCNGSSVTLTSSSPTGNFWSNTASAAAIVVGASGTFYVTANGCLSAPVTVTVNPLPGSFSASSIPVCQGSTLTLSATNSSGAASYSWTGPNGFTSSVQNPSIPSATAAATGTYTVTASTSAGCTRSATTTGTVFTNSLNGTYTVGTGQNFSTLTAAITAYNTSCLTGPVTFLLMDTSFPIPPAILNNSSSGPGTTLTIKPNTTSSIVGSASFVAAIVTLDGADYIIIDGTNTAGTERSLTIQNNTDGFGSLGVRLFSSSGNSASHNTIKNCIIKGTFVSATSSTEVGIVFGAGGSPVISNNNNIIENNLLLNFEEGIFLGGTGVSSNLETGNVISNNDFGQLIPSDNIRDDAIYVEWQNGIIISDNKINNLSSSNNSDMTGIKVQSSKNCLITRNLLHHITGGGQIYGIYLLNTSTVSPSNNTVSNNLVYDITSTNAGGPTSLSRAGIVTRAGNGDKIYYNSVYLSGQLNASSGSAPSSCFSNGLTGTAETSMNIDVKNNVFYMGGSGGTSATLLYAHYSNTTATSTTILNNNDLFVQLSGPGIGYIGRKLVSGSGVNYSTLANWQTATGQEANSISSDPLFSGTANLLPLTGSPLIGAAVPIAGITTDILGVTRNALTPTIGAFENAGTCTNVYYADADGDGFGNPLVTTSACTPPSGYVSDTTDCNDGNNAIHPGAAEICNGMDDDCDGLIDDADPDITGQSTWYADADGDGYGNVSVFVLACYQPSGYILNSTDCNDANNAIHPGAIEICNGIDDDCDGLTDDADPGITGQSTWYADADNDGFGNANSSTLACSQPSGYVSNNDDCNDTNPNINPTAQTLTFSEATNFTNSLVYPLTGTPYTDFAFEVNYTDATNSLPPLTFPRVVLDYEGNGIFNDSNDRVIVMSPSDVSDINTADGKKYIGTINSLSTGNSWQTRVQITNGTCLTQTGPFNYPDVVILPDLEIFASDILFSNPNPEVSSPLTIRAVIHNVSDFAAQNFYVHLVNQFDNSINYGDVLVPNIGPQSMDTVTWNITTPAVPAWCPMQVSIDYTNVINETNELDNSAIRPFINGDFNLPGGIVVFNSATSPSVGYTTFGATTTVSGSGFYFGTPIPLADSSVAGGQVTLTIVETNATYTTTTNSQGYFSFTFPSPSVIGSYHITGSLTDFTFTGNFNIGFTMVLPSCLPDLTTDVILSSYNIVAGNSISGTIKVTNSGCAASTNSTLLNIAQTGGSPVLADVTVPPLNPNQSFTTTFSSLTFNTPGTYSICGTADGTNLVVESSEANTDCEVIEVIPNMPDIYPAGGPCSNSSVCIAYICDGTSSIGFALGNSGGAATGQFGCEVIVKLNNSIIATIPQAVTNILAQSSVSFSIPFTYSSTGNYSFELRCDIPLPAGVVTEINENNNAATYFIQVLDCKPDLNLSDCELFDVQPVDPQFPGAVTYVATMSNDGNATASGPINVRFHLSGGTNYDTQYLGNLTPGQSTVVTVNAASVAPATQTLTAIADPFNTIDEWSESNSVTNSLCWDFEPVPLKVPNKYECGHNFWEDSYLVNQIYYLSIGLKNYYMYDASSVKIRFQVSGPGLPGTVTIGDAIVNNMQQSCNCPVTAPLGVSVIFPQVGTYTVTMTADPDGGYTECDEGNNVLIRTVNVSASPDLRVLSQYINPSLLNPDAGQPITLDVTYANIGYSNISDQMELRVLVDEIPLDSVFPVNGLITGDNTTISIPASWSSNTSGAHIIKVKIDSDNQINETNELNNEATRAVVVGSAANLYFQVFAPDNPSPALNSIININARIGNNGDEDCEANVQFFYQTNSLDLVQIGVIHVNINANDSIPIQLPWTVLDNKTTLIGKIINSSVLEFTYDDNEATAPIGGMTLSFTSTPGCSGGASGTIAATASGGEIPFAYLWNNSFNGQILTAGAGTYSVTVTDNTGQTVAGIGTITNVTGISYYADADGDGFGNATVSTVDCSQPAGYVTNNTDCNDNNAVIHASVQYYVDADHDGYGATSTAMVCASTPPVGYSTNNTDCNDNNINIHPNAAEVCGNGIDDDCDGLTDEGCGNSNLQHCAYTQGFYGNINGLTTCTGLTKTQAITQALYSPVPPGTCNPIIIGYGTKTLTIPCTSFDITCIKKRLPAGGTPATLPVSGNTFICDANGNSWLKNGKFKNTLLGQTIALSLNLRLFPDLGNVKITSSTFTTYAPSACVNGTPLVGTAESFSIPQKVINCLGTVNNNVSDLLDLANKKLGGVSICTSMTLGNLTQALDAVNRGFDRCRIAAGNGNIRLDQGNADKRENHLIIYPNPSSQQISISIDEFEGNVQLQIINLLGEQVIKKTIDINEEEVYSIDISSLADGIYQVILSDDAQAVSGKFVKVSTNK